MAERFIHRNWFSVFLYTCIFVIGILFFKTVRTNYYTIVHARCDKASFVRVARCILVIKIHVQFEFENTFLHTWVYSFPCRIYGPSPLEKLVTMLGLKGVCKNIIYLVLRCHLIIQNIDDKRSITILRSCWRKIFWKIIVSKRNYIKSMHEYIKANIVGKKNSLKWY